MKLFLLASLLTTLLFGCSSKGDDIINLKCTLKQMELKKGYETVDEKYWEIFFITVNQNNKTASFIEKGKNETAGTFIDKIEIKPDLIEMEYIKIREGFFDNQKTFKINRINGEITYIDFYQTEGWEGTDIRRKGECYEPESVETMF